MLAKLKKNGKPLFAPTTIMETVNEVAYVFVIEKAYLDSKDRVVFIVSTKDISLQKKTSKKLIDIQNFYGPTNTVPIDEQEFIKKNL